MSERASERPTNQLLAALPQQEFARVEPLLTEVQLGVRQVVYDVAVPIEHVYFPVTGIVSIVGIMSDGSAVEVATIGSEGMVGLPVALGTDKATQQAFSQIPGTSLRMRASDLKEELARRGALNDLLGRYTQALFTLVAQASACNRLHSTQERCARWLLLTHDRVSADTFTLTQVFLSQMLGVRRATVSEVAARLQKKRLIRYARGQMTIVNRPGLEKVSCECYEIIRGEFERLLRNGPTARQVLSIKRRASRDGTSLAKPPSPPRGAWERDS